MTNKNRFINEKYHRKRKFGKRNQTDQSAYEKSKFNCATPRVVPNSFLYLARTFYMSFSTKASKIPKVHVLSVPITNRFASLLSFIKSQTTSSALKHVDHYPTFILYFRSTLVAEFFADLLEYHFEAFTDGKTPKVHRYVVKQSFSKKEKMLRSWSGISSENITATGTDSELELHSNILICDERSLTHLFIQLPQVEDNLRLDWIYYYDLPTCPMVCFEITFCPLYLSFFLGFTISNQHVHPMCQTAAEDYGIRMVSRKRCIC